MIGLASVSRRWLLAAALILSSACGTAAQTPAAQAGPPDDECKDGAVLPVRPKTDLRSVKITGPCYLAIGRDSFFKDINIVFGGELRIIEAGHGENTKTNLWASSIIVENGGSLIVNGGNVYYNAIGPYGYGGGTLTIHLYGKDAAKWNPATRQYDSQNKGAVCKSNVAQRNGVALGPCGIPQTIWDSNGASLQEMPGRNMAGHLIKDYFYQYGALRGDGDCTVNPVTSKCEIGYFGNKVLAVAFGGTLDLYGFKGSIPPGWEGTPPPGPDDDALSTGRSWRRLVDGQSLKPKDKTLYIEKATMVGDPALRWGVDDEIVVTTTDYLPNHSEKLKIKNVTDDPLGMKIDFEAVDNTDGTTGLLWHHNGTRYGGPKDSSGPTNDPGQNQWTRRLPDRLKKSIDPALRDNGAETRAAVALLTRSIQIVSAGDDAGDEFPKAEDPNSGKASYSYGAHMVIRQGFEKVAIKGVEFRQMGQGGRLGHYPVHFHVARKTPSGTHVKDSSINESMTRWIVLHSTQGVTIARNVGYKSIGHGFYLEDGSETDNKFWSNIGIYARAALATLHADLSVAANPQNPRMIPGILSDNQNPKDPKFKEPNVANPGFPYRSDNEYPTVFWITNGWNDFVGNMAAGAGACGAAFWLVPASNMNRVEVPDPDKNKGVMTWSGYAELQGRPGFGGATPVKWFYKNYATSTMHSLQTTDDAPPCDGIIAAGAQPPDRTKRVMKAVAGEAPWPARKDVYDEKTKTTVNIPDNDNDHFYPHVLGGARMATKCEPSGDGHDCSPAKVPSKCGTGPDPTKGSMQHCAAVVIDHFTSSFHWAHGNVSAIWLRPQWYLVTNSVITDVQNGGLSFVTGGDYTHSSMINGYWGLVRNTVFVGNTNNYSDSAKNNPYAGNAGPFTNANTQCDLIDRGGADGYCLSSAAGISMPASGFFSNQRLLNIYDGPFYQDSNAYLDITTSDCPFLGVASPCMYGMGPPLLLLRKVPGTNDAKACYLPNAAIGWKQPNGFFYPPAFHSRNLFFDKVDLRHFVIAPSFQPNTYLTDFDEVKKQYCNGQPTMFNNWTSIDRQTELNDDDGTLTGLSNTSDGHLKQTISINEDPFFSAPVEAPECGSSLGANTYSANACVAPNDKLPPVTARTSPYDYVTTVIYHKATDDKDLWGADCTNQLCYGVPLFRQFLTDTVEGKDPTKSEMKAWKDKGCDKQEMGKPPISGCRWPFIRMAGAAISQRNTLTINNGTYYLDTTVSADMQKSKDKFSNDPPVAFNVFAPGKQYHVFFVYAKQSTKQTYQIWVGPGFDKDKHFELTNVNVETQAFSFLPKAAKTQWATASYDGKGLLTVEVDFKGLTTLDPTPDNGLCAPRTFCKVDGQKMCVSNLSPDDRLFGESDAVCRTWAVKDLDCPPLVYENRNGTPTWVGGGCPGFSFTLQSVVASDLNQRPQPKAYPTAGGSKPDWATKFSPPADTTGDRSGLCTYKAPLPDSSCPKKP